LDDDPIIAANLQVQKSATKMVLETAQLLSDCVRFYGHSSEFVYKALSAGHKNHPSTRWVRKSQQHFDWLYAHGLELAERYERMFGRKHASLPIIEHCGTLRDIIPNQGFSITAQDLAIRSTEAGEAAYQEFLESAQTFECVIIAYQKFYEAKEYVKKERQKLLFGRISQNRVIGTN
jgi:hypothetical protein